MFLLINNIQLCPNLLRKNIIIKVIRLTQQRRDMNEIVYRLILQSLKMCIVGEFGTLLLTDILQYCFLLIILELRLSTILRIL